MIPPRVARHRLREPVKAGFHYRIALLEAVVADAWLLPRRPRLKASRRLVGQGPVTEGLSATSATVSRSAATVRVVPSEPPEGDRGQVHPDALSP